MPKRQPFTALCQAAARSRHAGRADLHIHTTKSDGAYTPAQVIELARRSGLGAVAITDHDTLDGVVEAQAAALATGIEVVPGVEISAEYRGREFHLLGYFVRRDDAPLRAALHQLSKQREVRFWHMVERLRAGGVAIDAEELRACAGSTTLGRRHLAEFLVQKRCAGSVREAFARYLGDGKWAAVSKVRLPVEEAIHLVRGAGGVAAWAHPPYDCTRESLAELHSRGLRAVEVEYPTFRVGRVRQLRAWAAELGLAVTGGSDCHGPDHRGRALGARSVTASELEALRIMSDKG
jgi:hypothetical protein